MPDFLRVADGVVAKNRVDEAERDQFEALRRGVLAGQAKREQEERERRLSQGLPAELSPEEKKEQKRQEKEKRATAKEMRREALGQRKGSGGDGDEGKGRKVLGLLCFGAR
ncbi:hypothetical protein H2200_000235 [Cladophialophora chaetospira]|uniref:Uncharacterized protein n=1 Tax=Cladophialophora chaetospira TaxID=386627 RepID=A0AA38XND4_9EURO|nr:hypothetical protein H2200_000235 [Cladophialophora chaetospira]